MEKVQARSRLQTQDKRILFASLVAMADRLLFLNEFPPIPLDQFALSVFPADIEKALRKTMEFSKRTVHHMSSFNFSYNGSDFFLEVPQHQTVFPRLDKELTLELTEDCRYYDVVSKWCRKQARLEEQLDRTYTAIKAIVVACNTVGQYKRVSPELVTFLPPIYREGLKGYNKASPYPAISVGQEMIDAAMQTLACAAFQPMHEAEIRYDKAPKHSRYFSYHLGPIHRGQQFKGLPSRRLDI